MSYNRGEEGEEDLESAKNIDELFSNRPTQFDPQELEKLVDYSLAE
jgi:hypothetical protein